MPEACSGAWNSRGRQPRAAARSIATATFHFIVESLEGQHVRPGLARAVVESGWNLNELHAVGLSLEEIFLQLTGDARRREQEPHATIISRKPVSGETK